MLAKVLLGLSFLSVGYAPALAQPAFLEGTGVTIDRGKPASPSPRCHNDPNRASNDCPGQITVVLPPMEPAPDGAGCAGLCSVSRPDLLRRWRDCGTLDAEPATREIVECEQIGGGRDRSFPNINHCDARSIQDGISPATNLQSHIRICASR